MNKTVIFVAMSSLCLLSASAALAQCAGEPAAASACFPRVMPGTPGVHEVTMNVSTAVGAFAPACGGTTHGHGVWFEVTPTVSGLLTFSTCHPSTSYDTVLQPYTAGADCEFPTQLDDLCTDDTNSPACVSECQSPAARSSSVTFHVNAGTTYLFQVSSYGNNVAGCDLCLGVRATICGGDLTPPVATISAPTSLSCACGPVTIMGTVEDADGGIRDYEIEYAEVGSTTWTPVASGSSSIINGVLGTWNPSGLVEGLYLLRLTATNACGVSSTAVQAVWVDQSFGTLSVQSPIHEDVVGGQVCLQGTVSDSNCFDHYTASYRPVSSGAFQPVDPSMPVYSAAVTNSSIASWDTIGLGLPDGDYEVRVAGTTQCGNGASLTYVVTVDNTPPTANIDSPVECGYVDGLVQILGTANDVNLQSWTLQYVGGGSAGWTTIASGTTPVINGVLANWNADSLPFCAYALRLIVRDAVAANCIQSPGRTTEDHVSVNVGYCGDFDADDDGDVDLFDYGAFSTAFTGPLP